MCNEMVRINASKKNPFAIKDKAEKVCGCGLIMQESGGFLNILYRRESCVGKPRKFS